MQRHGLAHGRPHFFEKAPIAGEAEDLRDREDEFAVAVVLDQRIRTRAVDDAGHEAVVFLVAGVPADEVARLLRAAGAQQRGRHDRAVADPATRVATRPRLQGRTVAIEEDVRHRGPEGVGEALPALRKPEVEAGKLVLPLPDGAREGVGTIEPRQRAKACRIERAERDREVDVARGRGRQVQVEAQRRRRTSERIRDPRARRDLALAKMLEQRLLLESRGAEGIGIGERHDGLRAIDPHRVVTLLDLGDAPHAAEIAEGLPGRIHLEGPQRGEQAHGALHRRGVLEPVPDEEHRPAVLAHGIGGRAQREAIGTPHARMESAASRAPAPSWARPRPS